jgi:hypothetical protein
MSHCASAIDLYWLPLGAGGHFVRLNGRIYEAVVSWQERRPALDLYHSALEVRLPNELYVIESAPIRDDDGANRGVVGEGPVGARWAGRFRLFRYELRVWPGGRIPDIDEAVESPVRLSRRSADAQHLLDLTQHVPRPTWGHDELAAGEMWNSNSFIAWLLAATGLDVDSLRPPRGGRAPGWSAGVAVARRRARAISDFPQHRRGKPDARFRSRPDGRNTASPDTCPKAPLIERSRDNA